MKILFPLLFLLQFSSASDQIVFQRRWISVGGHRLNVEVAKTSRERSRGLMYRRVLKHGEGMLFVFEKEQPQSFWMKNTFIPLSIGFFSEEGRLNEVLDMKPAASELEVNMPQYESQQPARYALEVPQGWFSKQKIKPGALLKLD